MKAALQTAFFTQQVSSVSSESIPEYEGKLYAEVNNNTPDFTETDRELLSTPGYEYYSALDSLGRAGAAEACVGEETMPEGEQGKYRYDKTFRLAYSQIRIR